jgi:ATP-dependent DNA helicase RecG
MNKSLFDYPVQYIKGIGPRKAEQLSKIGIRTVIDALFYLPYRYEDRRVNSGIAGLKYEALQSATGKVVSAEIIEIPSRSIRASRKKLRIFELTISDGTGLLKGKWFNQPYMQKIFSPGKTVVLSGMVRKDPYWGIGYVMQNPEYEVVDGPDQQNIHTSRIVPIYRTVAGLGVRSMRSIMYSIINFAVSKVKEYMPQDLLSRHNMPSLSDTFLYIHFPPDGADLDELNDGRSSYHQRLAHDELFFLQTGLAAIRRGAGLERGISFRADGVLGRRLIQMLPFELTSAQKRVINEIIREMKSPVKMNRLLQGDVGSGKTIVALMAMLQAVESGYQTVLMAPTEILAEQHELTIHSCLEVLGVRSALLTGSRKARPLDEIQSGDVKVVIGTHALIQENVKFKRLGFVVIDEQHRFGVMQRASLRRKGSNPDVLVMTATPIPRTLSLTLYGDLNVSVIDELPPDRKRVITKLFHEKQKGMLYSFIRAEVKKGRQAYIVYPLIEESEKMSLHSAVLGKEAFEGVFPDFRVGLIHGRMNAEERDKVMHLFKEGEIDILVSTTVIEVGVDVPNATLMLIVHAERFGLSQLHQLRGRVGRGAHQSYCFLLAYGKLSVEARRRLDVMVRHSDGFRIAEEDFLIRGPGEFFGTRQSGMPDLKVANLIRDVRMLDTAREESFGMIEKDPDLSGYPELREMVEWFWHDKMEIFRTS